MQKEVVKIKADKKNVSKKIARVCQDYENKGFRLMSLFEVDGYYRLGFMK